MLPVRTTISCRLLVPLIACALVHVVATAATGALSGSTQQAQSASGVPVRPTALPTEPRWATPLNAAPLFPAVMEASRVVVPLASAVVGLRAADGVEVWRVERTAEQPLAALDSLIVVAVAESLQAFRAVDGAEAWRALTGTLTAPVLAQDGWVIAAAGTQLFALRASDGTVVWTREIPPMAEQPSLEGDRLYLPLTDGRIYSLVLATGADRWVRRLGGAPTPVLALADTVFVGSADRHFYAIDAVDGSIDWRFRVGAALRGRAAAEGPLVFAAAVDNLVRAFNRGDGALQWHGALTYRPTAGPLVVGGAVLVPGAARELPAFDALTGTASGTLTVAATLATPLTAGVPVEEPVLIAVTGDAAVGWRVSLLEPIFGLRVVPLTALPGEVVPIRIPTIPPPK